MEKLIALYETTRKFEGRLISRPGRRFYFKLEISHKQVFISIQEREYIYIYIQLLSSTIVNSSPKNRINLHRVLKALVYMTWLHVRKTST